MRHAWQRWRVTWNPERFQGWGKTRRYFEGWYFKLISPDEATALAVIPGIAYDEKGEGHAFVQVLDGRQNTATYHRFPVDAFQPSKDRFALQLGDNFFGQQEIRLNLPEVKGQVQFARTVPWPVKPLSPGIMGWYAFVPFMECYHGIVSMDTELRGALVVHGKPCSFEGGRGYLEKDWGRSFPSSWIWMQSNHFLPENGPNGQSGTSFKASVARIPWLGSAFVGFIGGLWHNNKLYRFTTYTGAKLHKVAVQDSHVELVIQDRRHQLEVYAVRSDGGELVSPVQGLMAGRVSESMSARLRIRLTQRDGQVVFEGEGRNAGLEVAGPYQELLMQPHL